MSCLSDFDHIRNSLHDGGNNSIVVLHKFVFARDDGQRNWKNLREFQGFEYDDNDEQYTTLLSYVEMNLKEADLVMICNLLGIGNDVDDVIKHIFKNLRKGQLVRDIDKDNNDEDNDNNTVDYESTQRVGNAERCVTAATPKVNKKENRNEEEELLLSSSNNNGSNNGQNTDNDDDSSARPTPTRAHKNCNHKNDGVLSFYNDDSSSNNKVHKNQTVPRFAMRFRDVKDSTRIFNGDDTISAETWIAEFEEMAKIMQWDQFQKYVFAKQSLRRLAKTLIFAEKRVTDFVLGLLALSLTCSLPTKSAIDPKSQSYASDASQIIATHLLKSYNDIDGNQVHSPLGIASMLAVLAEATQGETYEEFYKVLGYPREKTSLRNSFKQILKKYQTKKFNAEPSFQSWLYIYRNFSAREDFKQLVQDYYYVDVKDINRDEYDWSEPNTSLDLELDGTTSNSKDVIGFETLKRIKLDDNGDDDDLRLGQTTVGGYTDGYGDELIEKETSKFDRFVDDKQYVEKPQIVEEIRKEKEEKPLEQQQTAIADVEIKQTTESAAAAQATQAEKLENLDEKPAAIAEQDASSDAKDQTKREDDLNLQENETVQENEKILKNYKDADVDDKLTPIQDVLESNEPEKVTLPLQKLETVLDDASKSSPTEIMLALESHVSAARSAFGSRSLFQRDDIASALSANSMTGRDIGSQTKMLLFNGLYYRGSWATLFQEKRDAEEFFFMTADDAMKTPMMHAQGKFHMAELENLNAKVLCLAYENKKYSLMIVLPNEMEGLHALIEKIEPNDFKAARSLMKERDLHVILPKFQIEETSRSESMLKSLGLTKLFSRSEADLSLMSDDRDLHVDEIVQFVNVRVDEGGNSLIGLSASNTEGRNTTPPEAYEMFEINHPFLYFVMDCESEFVLVSGKVHAPEVQEELPLDVAVELDQA